MAKYKKNGKIGDILYMENKDGKIADAGIVTDFKNGKIITEDADGKKHQYAEDNKKIVGFISAVDDEIFEEPTTMADIATTKPIQKPQNDSQNPAPASDTFIGIVNTVKERLNVRIGAGMNYPVIKTLNKGSNVELYKKMVNGWYKLADESGYVAGNLIKK